MTDRNRTYQTGRVSIYSDVQCGSANRQTSFAGRGNVRIKLSFSGHIANKFRKPTILQLNIEGLTASKINILHHLAMQSKALVILLQETHCTDAEKLVLPNYQPAGSSLSRKNGLATFVHERLRYTLLDQSPPTSEIEWLCVDVDGYKIVNIYKPPPTRLRTVDLPVFPHPCLYAGDFNCRHADWGYDDNSPDGECLAGWAGINCLAHLYNAKDAASFYSGRWNTGTNPDLAFASVRPNSRLPDRRVLDKFPRSQHRPSLITPPRFAMAVPSISVKRWNFCKAKWSHYIALTNKLAKTLLPPDSLDVDTAYQDFCNTIRKAAKTTIPSGYRNNYILCWDAECESLYKTLLQSSQGDDSSLAATAKYCAQVWCRSAHTRLIDSVLNDSLLIVTGCLRPTPTDHLAVLSGIQPAELCQMGATLSLAHRGSLDPDHIYGLLSGSSDTCQVRLRSRRPFVPAARNLLDNLARLGIRASKWTNNKWKTEYCKNASRLRVFMPKTSARSVGMGLPRAA